MFDIKTGRRKEAIATVGLVGPFPAGQVIMGADPNRIAAVVAVMFAIDPAGLGLIYARVATRGGVVLGTLSREAPTAVYRVEDYGDAVLSELILYDAISTVGRLWGTSVRLNVALEQL